MFKSPVAQWEAIFNKSLDKQYKFLNKVCKVNRRDALVIREAFFNKLSFALVQNIFDLVERAIENDKFDGSFREIVFDRLLGISNIAHLYPENRKAADNLIHGEQYHIYSACYNDLDIVNDFIDSHQDITTICDLGSGSGRSLFYMALKAQRRLDFLGLELVKERIDFTNNIANGFCLDNLRFKQSNFLESPKDFDGFSAYYLFDPVGTNDVPLLISYFEKLISDGAKFYMLFISGWDDIMLNALNKVSKLELLSSSPSSKQDDRYVNFYKVTD